MLVFADWAFPVAAETRVLEYAHVPFDGRTGELPAVRDLLLGGDTDDDRDDFYRAGGVAVDPSGRIYVLDAGNHRVQVFDADGKYMRTFGAEGQGPGELQSPVSVSVAADQLLVADAGTSRVNRWSLDGSSASSVPLGGRSLAFLVGLDDGSFVGLSTVVLREERRLEHAFVRISADGSEPTRYPSPPIFPDSSVAVPDASPSMAATPSGRVYVAAADHYQVLALTAAGETRWALRTDWPTPPVPEEIFDRVVAMMRERNPTAEDPRDRWRKTMPAIGNIEVDGDGNLYVFPYRFIPHDPRNGAPLEPLPTTFPVDVYSPEGEHLFSGTLPIDGWLAAHENHVYRIERDPETEEQQVVRYRLDRPF